MSAHVSNTATEPLQCCAS